MKVGKFIIFQQRVHNVILSFRKEIKFRIRSIFLPRHQRNSCCLFDASNVYTYSGWKSGRNVTRGDRNLLNRWSPLSRARTRRVSVILVIALIHPDNLFDAPYWIFHRPILSNCLDRANFYYYLLSNNNRDNLFPIDNCEKRASDTF